VILPRIRSNMKIDTTATAVLSDLILWSLDTILARSHSVAAGTEPQSYVVRVFDSSGQTGDGVCERHLLASLSCHNLAAVIAVDNENCLVREDQSAEEASARALKFIDLAGLEHAVSQFLHGQVKTHALARGKRNVDTLNASSNAPRCRNWLSGVISDNCRIVAGMLALFGLFSMLYNGHHYAICRACCASSQRVAQCRSLRRGSSVFKCCAAVFDE
jgi:hypothetical protein